MCGGIATALASGAPASQSLRSTLPLLHGCGRLISYGTAGAVAARLGVAALRVLNVEHWSVLLRLCSALVMVIIGLKITLARRANLAWLRTPERLGALIWRRIAPVLSRRLPRAPVPRAFAAGLLWGWLPCGLVYSVLLAAATSGTPLRGALTMLAFGAGTIPALAALGYLGARPWAARALGGSAKLAGIGIVVCGLWTAAIPLATLAGIQGHHHKHLSLGTGVPP
jgi:sulfite exporter TauE/SafE